MRLWKALGMAGLAGVAATGVIIARDQRQRAQLTPDEIRARLRSRVENGADADVADSANPAAPAAANGNDGAASANGANGNNATAGGAASGTESAGGGQDSTESNARA